MQPARTTGPSTPGQSNRQGPTYDQALKRLLTKAHDGLLSIIAPDLHWLGERSTELPAVARQADLVWEVVSADGIRSLLHIELQAEPDEEMGERLAEYRIRLWRRDHLDLDSAVIYLRPTVQLPHSPFVIPSRRGRPLSCDFEVVKLWELPAERVLETGYYDLWPLASQMGNVSVEQAVAIGERIAAAPLPAAERSELTGLLIVLAELRLRRREVLDALRRNQMIDEIVRNSSLAEVFFEEGEAKGRAEGMRTSIRLVLEGRFGSLDQALLDAISHVPDAELERLVILSAKGTLDDVRVGFGLG